MSLHGQRKITNITKKPAHIEFYNQNMGSVDAVGPRFRAIQFFEKKLHGLPK